MTVIHTHMNALDAFHHLQNCGVVNAQSCFEENCADQSILTVVVRLIPIFGQSLSKLLKYEFVSSETKFEEPDSFIDVEKCTIG